MLAKFELQSALAIIRFGLCQSLGLPLALVILLAQAALVPPTLRAQRFANWDVIRVYISDSDVQQVASSDYEVMSLDELVEQLEREKIRQESAEFNIPRLDQAIYVANLENQEIVSEQSRWIFSGKTMGRPLNLGTISLALAKAQGTQLAGRDQLIGNHRVSPGGYVQLDLPGGEVERWFGFSVRPTNDGRDDEYRMRLPLATSGVLLLSVPRGQNLSSDDVVLHPTETPKLYVPSDWPTVAQLESGTAIGRQWWVIYLSGVENFRLAVSDQVMNEGFAEGHVIDEASFDYTFRPNKLDLSVEYKVASEQIGSWVLEHAPPLRLESLVVNGESILWDVIDSGEKKVTLDLAFPETISLDSSSITLRANFVAQSIEQPVSELPWVRVRNSAVIAGRTFVHAVQGLVVEKLTGTSTASRESQQGEGWSFSWTENAPQVLAQFGVLESRLVARSITSLNAQSDWLSAKSRLRLEIPKLNSNELSVRIGNGWFVDDTNVLQGSPDLELRLIESDAGQGTAATLLLVWSEIPKPSDVEIEVSAHRPIRFQNDTVRILSRRLLTVPAADQIDNYVISPSTRYQIELSDRLLLSQIRAEDLPEWQQETLIDQDDQWLLQGRRSVTPQINLRAAKGRYNTRMVAALIKRSPSAIDATPPVTYYLRVEPIEQALDSLTVSLPSDLPADLLTWRVQDQQSPGESAINQQVISSNANKQICRLSLGQAKDEPFTLVASLPVTEQGDLKTLPVLGMPDAVVADSTIVLSDHYSIIDSEENSFELLPLSACCGDGILSDLVLEQFADKLHELIGARLEAKSQATILLRDTSREVVRRGWIWSESIQTLVSDAETQRHRIEWTVEASKTDRISVKLPKGWWLERALLNGEIVRSLENRVLNEIEIAIPVMQTSQLELDCASGSQQSNWIQRIGMPLPVVNFDVLQSQYRLLIAPSKTPIRDFSLRNESSIWQRFNPQTWWTWMAPSSNLRLVDLDFPGWTTVDKNSRLLSSHSRNDKAAAADNRESTTFVWIINRNTLAVFATGTVIVLACMFSLLLRSSIRGYWYSGGVLSIILALAPESWIGMVQLSLLALAAAALLKLARVVFSRKSSSDESEDESWAASLSAWTKQLLAGSLLLVCQPLQAQTQSETESANQLRPSFKVLIPENSSQVYVPSALRNLLREPVSEKRSGSAGILEARYEIKIGELIAEFRVFAPNGTSQLSIPIDAQDLSLLNAQVNGQANELQIEQRPDRIVFLPDMAGEHSLLLRFLPAVETDENAVTRLRALVPQVPASSLRVSLPQNLSAECLLQGVPISVAKDSRLALGSVDELDVRWFANGSESNEAISGYESDLWIKATGSQIVASATVRLEQASALGEQFSLLFAEDWKPVGSDWGGVRMLSAMKEPLGNRQLYNVSPKSPNTELVINVLLVPVNPNSDSLSTPFPQIAGLVVPVTRSMRWTAEETTWQSEGALFWPRQALSSQDGNAVQTNNFHKLSEDWEAFRVPPGSSATRIIKQNETTAAVAIENNLICYLGTEARIEYRMQMTSEEKNNVPLRFQIPDAARVEKMTVDGVESTFQLIRSGDQSVLLAQPATAEGQNNGAQELRVETEATITLVHPISIGKPQPIRRVVAMDVIAESSVVEIYRKPNLRCQLTPKQDELTLPLSTPEPDVADLAEMRIKLVEWDWEDQSRYSCDLPADVQVARQTNSSKVQSVFYVDRSNGAWTGRLVTEWDWDGDQADFVYFRIPSQIRDQISVEGEVQYRYISTGDADYEVLACIPADSASSRKRVELTCPLQSGTSVQTVAIPNVSIVEQKTVSPILSLPQTVDGNLVEWIDSGSLVNETWTDPFISEEEQTAREYHTVRQGPLQVLWERADRSSRRMTCSLSLLRVSESNADIAVGRIDYWLRPNGQSTLELNVPDNLEILGVVAGNQLANWSQADNQTTIVLQPNYLPIKVRLLCQWNLGTEAFLRLPSAGCLSDSTPLIVESESQTVGLVSTAGSLSNGINVSGTWKDLIEENRALLQGLAVAEREAWLQGWHPLEVGLGEDDQILIEPETGGEPDYVSVIDLWTETCDSLTVMPPVRLGRDIKFADSSIAYRAASRSFETGYGDLQAITTETSADKPTHWWLAGILVVGMLIVPQGAKAVRESYLEVLATHPWTYWLQLAGLAYLLLPVTWPSSILLLTSCGMAISQWLEYRRMHRYR